MCAAAGGRGYGTRGRAFLTTAESHSALRPHPCPPEKGVLRDAGTWCPWQHYHGRPKRGPDGGHACSLLSLGRSVRAVDRHPCCCQVGLCAPAGGALLPQLALEPLVLTGSRPAASRPVCEQRGLSLKAVCAPGRPLSPATCHHLRGLCVGGTMRTERSQGPLAAPCMLPPADAPLPGFRPLGLC